MFELSTIKRIIILVIFALCIYILYRLIVWRQTLLSIHPHDIEDLLEGKSVKGKNESFETMPTIRNNPNSSLPLKEYVIFSSWNTCWSGNAITTYQIEKVMQNGCRFLDFEIYNIDGMPEIGYSTSGYDAGQTIPEIESDTLPLLDVCEKILQMRVAGSVPNKKDPLFLHFRIKSDHTPLLEKMAEAFTSSGIADPLTLALNVTPDTILSSLENKIIIVIDKGYVPNIKNNACPTGCATDLRDMVGLYSNSSQFSSDKWEYLLNSDGDDPLKKKDDNDNDNTRTNVSILKMIAHHAGTEYKNKNEEGFRDFVLKHKVQFVPHKFFYQDKPLTEYKNFFSDYGHRAFISMAVAYDELSRNSIN